MARRFSHVIGVDDAPFTRDHRGAVTVVGTCLAAGRLDGVIATVVRRDGSDATTAIATMVRGSRFWAHGHALLLQGIAVAGFNVIDIAGLHAAIDRPVLVIARRRPDLARIRRALLEQVRGGARKWALIEAAGPMEPCAGLWVQRAGLDLDDAHALITATTVHGAVPEPLRLAHLIAGGVIGGHSRGRA